MYGVVEKGGVLWDKVSCTKPFNPKEYATMQESTIDRFIVPVPQSQDVMTERSVPN